MREDDAARAKAFSDELEARLRLPARTLGPHRADPLFYTTVFVIAHTGNDDPAWVPMNEALDLVLAADKHILGTTDITYWGEVAATCSATS